MPMPNLRHQIKKGKKERRTGTVTPALDRSFFLSRIVQPAPPGQAPKTHVPSTYIRLPAIQKTEAEAPKKTAKSSRIPVWVGIRFNNPPKCGSVVPKVREMPTRRPSKLGYGVASGDKFCKSDAVADPPCVAESWRTDSMAGDKRKRIEKYAKEFDVYVTETAEAMEREKQEEIRKQRIEKYANIFDVYVRETAEAMEREKQEEIRKQRIEKYAKIFDVYVRDTAEAMEREEGERCN